MKINVFSTPAYYPDKQEIQKSNTKNPSFGLIKLEYKDAAKAKSLIKDLALPEIVKSKKDSLIIELYNLFEPYIIEEGNLKAKSTYILEEVIQDIKVLFLELICKIGKNTNIEYLISKIDEYKPDKNLVKQEWRKELSLDTPLTEHSKSSLGDFITEDNLTVPQSAEEIDKIKTTLNHTIQSSTDLPPKTISRLKARSKGKTYKEIAEEENVSSDRVNTAVHTGILRIQAKNGTIPKEDKKRISELSEILGIKFEDGLKIVSNNYIFRYLYPETINKNVETSAKLLKISKEEFIKAALKKTQLLYQSPDTLNENIEILGQLLGVNKRELIQTALKDPHLFYQSPQTLNKNAETLAELSGIPKKELIKAILRNPSIICQSPETLNKKAETSAKLFDISKEEFVKAALRQPQLFYQSPQTLNKNAETLTELSGIPKKELMKAVLRNPAIICQSPETLNKNTETSAKLFDISKEEFVKAALKQPQLFYQSPQTLNKNIETLTKLLECKKEELIKAALSQPSLFYQAPATLNKNIELSAQNFNMTKKDFLKIAFKYPALFYLAPESLLRHSKLLSYYRQIQNKKDTTSVTACFASDKKIYTDIFVHLMQSNGHSKYNHKETINRLPEILNTYKDSVCLIKIPANEVTDDVIKFIEEYSTKILGENVFEFTIVN